jgi:hypothetical protein
MRKKSQKVEVVSEVKRGEDWTLTEGIHGDRGTHWADLQTLRIPSHCFVKEALNHNSAKPGACIPSNVAPLRLDPLLPLSWHIGKSKVIAIHPLLSK